jgi:hypothetical protein
MSEDTALAVHGWRECAQVSCVTSAVSVSSPLPQLRNTDDNDGEVI